MIGLNRRRTMGNALPYDAEIEYLEASGTQCIDTGIFPDGTTKAELRGVLSNLTGSFRFGSRQEYNKLCFLALAVRPGTIRVDIGTSLTNDTCQWHSTNQTCHTLIINAQNKRAAVKYGNTTLSHDYLSSTPLTNPTSYALFLFAMNDGGSVGFATGMKLSVFKCWKSDILVMDMIPVRVGQTGYMYDKVSGQLFGNSGTGNFILGNDVN